MTETDTHSSRTVLTVSTTAFTLMFAVWLMFGVLSVPIRQEFGVGELELSWLTAIAILSGSLWRLVFGVLADRFGGRVVMTGLLLFASVPTFLVSQVTSFTQLLVLAFFTGIAGNSFSAGISWNSAWFPKGRQGAALGLFGAGNVGASITKLIGPALILLVPVGGLIPGGWRFIPFAYAVALALMAAITWFAAPQRDRRPGHGKPIAEMLEPLRHVRVWRFSLYYVVVFGAYVALSSWLPRFYVDTFKLELHQAALLTALFIFPASLLRPLGGVLSDRFGARTVMYWTFASLAIVTLPLGIVASESLGLVIFTGLVCLVGVAMGIGKAAVFKYIPEYFPHNVGSVGGLVGMLGALGGFLLPPLFAYAFAATHLTQSAFDILLVITLLSAAWLHVTVLGIKRHALEVSATV